MKQMNLHIDMENAAFDNENDTIELARILNIIQTKVLGGKTEGVIIDINGNHVGKWSVADLKPDEYGRINF